MQEAEKEGQNTHTRTVYFISLVGVGRDGNVDVVEYIYDVYTKLYDFLSTDVKILSAQDLWNIYQKQHTKQREIEEPKGIVKRIVKAMSCRREHGSLINDGTICSKDVDIYQLVESFIKNNSDGHFIIDECPFIKQGRYL